MLNTSISGANKELGVFNNMHDASQWVLFNQ